MQKQNDYEKGVFNGDMGAVFALGNDSMHVRYPEQDIRYKGNDLGEISLAYAVTVHKSQGSEYDTVIIVLVNSHSIMLQRNLLYTAVTRAKKKVILVGTKAALQRAVRATDKSKRYTLLAQRLKEMKYAESWGKVFKNLLFPPACPGCGCYVSTEAEWCEDCRRNLLHPRFWMTADETDWTVAMPYVIIRGLYNEL